MQSVFSNLGIEALDFVQIAAGFLLLMALIFGDKTRGRFWTNVMHAVFTFQCLLIIIFSEGLTLKLWAGLLLLSTAIVRVVVARRKTRQATRLST